MTVILPTGCCFDDILDFQSDLWKADPARAMRQHIVHGICLIPPDQAEADQPYAHGWVEDDIENRVYSSGMVDGQKVWWAADRDEWYRGMRVQEKTRYTFWEALQMNWKTNHYGPWVETYRALCKEITSHD